MNKTYGLLAEFSTHEKLIHAAEKAYAAGFRKMDGFAPFAVEGLAEALGKKNRLPLLVLIGGIIGGAGGYFMEWYANAISYPINIGGRPIHSWPAFIPITFELTVLCAGTDCVLWIACTEGLPRPYHPLFHIPEFDRASQDRFFLCIEARDPRFHPKETRASFCRGSGRFQSRRCPNEKVRTVASPGAPCALRVSRLTAFALRKTRLIVARYVRTFRRSRRKGHAGACTPRIIAAPDDFRLDPLLSCCSVAGLT